jgi:hypothetical protein
MHAFQAPMHRKNKRCSTGYRTLFCRFLRILQKTRCCLNLARPSRSRYFFFTGCIWWSRLPSQSHRTAIQERRRLSHGLAFRKRQLCSCHWKRAVHESKRGLAPGMLNDEAHASRQNARREECRLGMYTTRA